MFGNCDPASFPNPFSGMSVGNLCSRRADVEANAQSFGNDFRRQLMGVFQTSEKELRALPPSEQTLGSAWRDGLKGALLRAESTVHLLDKASTKNLIKEVNASLGLTVNLSHLSSDCAVVIESLSNLLTTIETKIAGRNMDDFVIPQTLRDEVENALKVVTNVSKLVGTIDKARPSPMTPIVLPASLGLISAIFPAIKVFSELSERLNASDDATMPTASPSGSTSPSVGEVSALIGSLLFTTGASSLAFYNFCHRAPSLRPFNNALAGLESQLDGLTVALSSAREFVAYINAAPRDFYSTPSPAIRRLAESDFPGNAFDEPTDAVAATEGGSGTAAEGGSGTAEDVVEAWVRSGREVSMTQV